MSTRFRWLTALLVVASCALASAAQAQVLYWIDTSFGAPTLNKADVNGSVIANITLGAGTLPEGIASDAAGKVYWTEAAWTGARVQRVPPTLGPTASLVTGGSSLRGIAVDDVDHLLYWTSSNLITGARIHRAALDGSGAITLIPLGVGANPRGIAVDHAGGKIYWADFDQDAIYRANLNGSLAELWQALPAQAHPYGVALDPAGQQVYWTEYAGKVRRVPTIGGAPATILAGLANPTYLAIDPAGGTMFWSEGGAGAQHIWKANLNGGSKAPLPLPLTTYGGIAFQPNATISAPGPGVPTAFALAPLSPNPGRGAVRVAFALPRAALVRLSVLDLQGRVVAVLAEGVFPAGLHEAVWGHEAPQGPVPAGIYFVRLASEGRAWTRRIVRVP